MSDLLTIAYRALDAAGLLRRVLVPITTGLSGAQVLRGDGVVLKIVSPDLPHVQRSLESEAAATRWLHGRVRVPHVLWSGGIDGYSVLAMEEIVGRPLYAYPPDAHEAGLAAIVRALAALHALPHGDCPLDARLRVRIVEAGVNVEAGVVDESDFDDEHAGVTAAALYETLLARCPSDATTTAMTHGDACIPNFILGEDGAVALIDLGRAGVGDPYQDFALFLRSAAFNFPTLDARAILVREYPLRALDDERLAFFRLLDEFF